MQICAIAQFGPDLIDHFDHPLKERTDQKDLAFACPPDHPVTEIGVKPAKIADPVDAGKYWKFKSFLQICQCCPSTTK